MVSATPFCFCAMQKHLTVETTRRARIELSILRGENGRRGDQGPFKSLTFPIRDFSEYSCTFPAKTA
jgi:hypothetical protein